MAIDKAIDSARLAADLACVANAIRAKSGGSSPLAFPAGFVSEAAKALSVNDLADLSKPSGPIRISAAEIGEYAFNRRSGITDIDGTGVTALGNRAFELCVNLERAWFPDLTTVSSGYNYIFSQAGTSSLNGVVVLPALTKTGGAMFQEGSFKAVDLGPSCTGLGADAFHTSGDSAIVEAVILRRTAAIVTAASQRAIDGVRDVWVPNALIDSYKAANNWKTRVDAGLITFHAIEGSVYENRYADGTAISQGAAE